MYKKKEKQGEKIKKNHLFQSKEKRKKNEKK